MSDLVSRAKELAYRAHAGQVDKAGRPYIEHVARVAAAVSDDPEAEAVAWLHDVLEDCHGSGEDILDFPARLVKPVIALTRWALETDEHYYPLVRAHPIALRVKLADIADNADESRLALLDDNTAERLRRKYAKARKALGVGGE
ncbi:HD domain-containing protein [Luteimonas cucumeris]|uniref:HD domain-containing protein n=1 Tax=Luteimonas cucumeris TaxID=985012 RepID=A0A562LB19_9GAMM|nr:HD domain-containing protein [Luteimonas cucumeris]TWI04857.1 HD domain-containing protein [Luteimonas cucumeris]